LEGAKVLITDDQHTTDKLEKVFLKTKKELSEENIAFLKGWKNFKDCLS
jgi:methylmalonyl-CoA mutase